MRSARKSLLLISLLGLGCGEPSAPARIQARSAESLAASATLMECPSTTTVSGSGVLDALGGTISAGGVTVTVPAGALLTSTTISVTVPASRYMEVDVSVAGVDHFIFQQPITVSVNYSRCNRNLSLSPFSIWYIDSATKQPLEQMPTLDDKLTQTATFTTGHLSGYALAD